jgi:NAD(P)-dependent dehydrogenase (short-subunit alcohol dehydrogenase family)
MMRLLGRVALVTGATSAAGAAIVAQFAEAGVSVVALDDASPRDRSSPAAACVHGDPACPRAVGTGVSRALEEFGRLDMLVTGVPTVEAALAGGRAALPALQARGGSIVNVARPPAADGDEFETHAAAARHGGIVALTRSMALTYAPHGIRCNAICLPGSARHGWPGAASSLHDLARTALHLSSPQAGFVTGTVVGADTDWRAA